MYLHLHVNGPRQVPPALRTVLVRCPKQAGSTFVRTWPSHTAALTSVDAVTLPLMAYNVSDCGAAANLMFFRVTEFCVHCCSCVARRLCAFTTPALRASIVFLVSLTRLLPTLCLAQEGPDTRKSCTRETPQDNDTDEQTTTAKLSRTGHRHVTREDG